MGGCSSLSGVSSRFGAEICFSTSAAWPKLSVSSFLLQCYDRWWPASGEGRSHHQTEKRETYTWCPRVAVKRCDDTIQVSTGGLLRKGKSGGQEREMQKCTGAVVLLLKERRGSDSIEKAIATLPIYRTFSLQPTPVSFHVFVFPQRNPPTLNQSSHESANRVARNAASFEIIRDGELAYRRNR